MRWLTAILMLIASTAWADLATVRVSESGDDGWLYQQNQPYATTCEWNEYKSLQDGTPTVLVGDYPFGAGKYGSAKGLLRFDTRGLNGVVNACTLYVYCAGKPADAESVYVSRVDGFWWPYDNTSYTWGRPGAGFLSSTLLGIEPKGEISASQWSAIVLDSDYILAGRYIELRLEDAYQRTCATPPGAARYTTWYAKDQGGVGDDTYTPYLSLDYDPSEVNCYTLYVPNGNADGYLVDSSVPICTDANETWKTQTTMVCGEKSVGPTADEIYIRFNIADVPAAERASMTEGESAWLTFTVNAKGADNFANLQLWYLDYDFNVLDTDDWGRPGTLIKKYPYGDLTAGEAISFDVTGYVTSAYQDGAAFKMPFRFDNALFCDGSPPTGDETCGLRTSEYAGTSSDPVLVICTFTEAVPTHKHGPIVSPDPATNPMVKVKPK